MKRLTTIWKSGIAGKLLVGCGGLIGLAIVCGICGTPFAQKPAPTPHPTATPYPAPSIPAQPTPTPIPPSPTPIPSTPTAIPTPTSEISTEDAIYLLTWTTEVGPWYEKVIDLTGQISQAAEMVDIVAMCQLSDEFVLTCGNILARLDELPSPSHPYLINSHDNNRAGIVKWGAAGRAIQEFCDTMNVDELSIAGSLMEEGTQYVNAATEWLNKYQEDIQ